MREKILDVLEKNGRIDLKEMAIMLGYSEAEVANEIADMEKGHIICGYYRRQINEVSGSVRRGEARTIRFSP